MRPFRIAVMTEPDIGEPVGEMLPFPSQEIASDAAVRLADYLNRPVMILCPDGYAVEECEPSAPEWWRRPFRSDSCAASDYAYGIATRAGEWGIA